MGQEFENLAYPIAFMCDVNEVSLRLLEHAKEFDHLPAELVVEYQTDFCAFIRLVILFYLPRNLETSLFEALHFQIEAFMRLVPG